jgi:predicted helicase
MLKKDAMKNSIFAVDIEPSAVDITKLRLWLSLVVEFDINSDNDEFKNPPTLPNLECNILCGNSLIDEFEGVKLFNDSLLTGASSNSNWMADLFQNQVDSTLTKLIDKQKELFYANNHDDKYRLKREIDVLQQQVIFASCTMTDDIKERFISTFAMPSKPYILWKLAFAKVFKDKGGFDIVIGNPPYLYLSKSEYNVDAYRYETDGKTRLKERNPKGLNDDYVKFMRFAEKHIAEKGKGILAFITNSGYLDNPTFRGLRASLLRTYDDIYMLNLHGNSIKREVAPDGSKDENVFDIRIGVAIMIAIKTTSNGEWGHAYYSEVYGLREKKFEYLRKGEFNFKLIGLDKHTALFIPQEDNNKIEYDQGISLEELFDLTSTGIDSGNDDVTIKRYKSELESTVDNIKQASCEEDIIRIMGKMCSGQTPTRILKDILSEQGKITPISYRPFDNRYTYYSGMSCGWLSRPRDKQIMMSIVNITNNVALVYQKQSNKKWTDIFVADNIIDAHLIGSKSYVAPLYINKEGLIAPLVNLNADKLKELTQYLLDLPTPMDVFAYCYGVLYSKRYRELYDSFLKQDTPKIPIPNNQESFDKYVIAGKRLTSLHLMQSDICANINLERIDSDNLCIEQVKYLEGKLYINKHVFISGISQSVWNYYIGGYQVLDKWLKSLKGEILDGERFCHFKKMVAIIEETINIQENI